MERLNKTYGGTCYERQIQADLLHEPVVVCEVEKRRKCDSAYIKLYKDLQKEYNSLLNKYEQVQGLLKIYQEILDESVQYLKGGENNE